MRSVNEKEFLEVAADTFKRCKGSPVGVLRFGEDVVFRGTMIPVGTEIFFPRDGGKARTAGYFIVCLKDGASITGKYSARMRYTEITIKPPRSSGSSPRSTTASTGRLVGSMIA